MTAQEHAYRMQAQVTAFRELREMVEEHGDSFVREWLDEIAAEIADCTCRLEPVTPTMVSPPEVRRDEWCPVHGRDPDAERDRQIDDKLTGDA